MKAEGSGGSTQKFRSHEWYMGEALKEARKAYDKDETPVGAVIVKDGKVIARGHNEKELKQDPTFHAEIAAIKKACKKLNSGGSTTATCTSPWNPAQCAQALLYRPG